MELYDVIVVGSGPAGTFSTYGLPDKTVLMLDVGYTPEISTDLEGNLDELRQKTDDLFIPLIGAEFESMHNLHLDKISYKLKAPYMSYILRNWQALCPVKSNDFETMMSFAQGGLANAWGAGVYQFNDKDLEGFPISKSDLKPIYRELTDHIGISGENDDLSDFFGVTENLLPPLKRSSFAETFLSRYKKQREHQKLDQVAVGTPRLAVLSKAHNGRRSYSYDRMDFFKPHNPAVYNPVFTLNDLRLKPTVTYKDGYLVTHYQECDGYVEVSARSIEDESIRRFRARKLILAAGALSTAKIVLTSNSDTETRLPIMDNPMACIPLVDYKMIGSAVEYHDSPLAQLNLILNQESEFGPIQASLYGSTGPLRTDVSFGFPLSVRGNLAMTKYLAPASGLMMVFFPGHKSDSNFIQLNDDNSLQIAYGDEGKDSHVVKKLMTAFRQMGYLCMEALNQYPKIGNSLHYGGILPMKQTPGDYETHSDGRLYGTKSVYIADGACFSALPAKNLTFTIMANALRIARNINSDPS